jgi:uncharacterized protein (TIGR03435 family)
MTWRRHLWRALLLAALGAAHAGAQSSGAAPPRFEVASVKPRVSTGGPIVFNETPGGIFTAQNARVTDLIHAAYGDRQMPIEGLPEWASSTRFDLNARATMPLPTPAPGQPGPIAQMLRALLEDRFALAVRTETRDLPIYVLRFATPERRLGPRMRATSEPCVVPCLATGYGFLKASVMTMPNLAGILSGRMGRRVVDKTDLPGTFTIDLTYTPEQPARPDDPPADPNGPSFFTALEEQLGLKLESTRGPAPVLIVERIERPTPD